MRTGVARPSRARRNRAAGGGLVITMVVAGALLAGCTHGGGDGTSVSGPGPTAVAGAGAAGTGATAPTVGPVTTDGAAAPESGPGGTGSPGTAAGPVVVTTAVGTVTTTVTVPPAADPLGAVATHPTSADEAAVDKILPGAYGLSSLGAHVHGATIDLAAQGGCDFALDVIRSGQWALTPVLSPHDGVQVHLDVLSRGDRSALLTLTESAGLCTGRIVTETRQALSLTGTVSATGPARAVTVTCLAQIDEDAPPSHAVVVSYRTGDAALLMIVTVPDAVGTHPVDPDNAAGVVVLGGPGSALVRAAGVARAFFDPTAITQDAVLPGVDAKHAWFQGKGATVTVTSSDPLTGSLDAPRLKRESGGGAASFSAGFSC